MPSKVRLCNNQTARNVYISTQQQCDLFRQSNFHVSYRRRIPAMLIWPLQSIASGCQSSEMAALLNSLSFAFANSFLPKYRVKYLLINLRSPRDCPSSGWVGRRSRLYVLDRKLLERLMSPSPKSQVMFASAFS